MFKNTFIIISRSAFLLILILFLAACNNDKEANNASDEEDVNWPNDDVTVVVPAEAGSLIDLVARTMTDYLQEETGQAFVVENDVSGNGTVAYEKVRNAKQDGLTLLFTQNLFLQYHGDIYDKEPFENFEVVGLGPRQTEAYILVARPDEEYSDWEELKEYAKANPGEITAGIQNGGMAHMLNEILNTEAGVEMKMVEAGSSNDKISGVLGGYIDVAFVATQTGAQYIESGDLISLMTTTEEPSSFNEEWPTSVELGYPDVVNVAMVGLFAPKGTDSALIEEINKTLAGLEDDSAVQEQLEKLVSVYEHHSPDKAEQILREYEEIIINGYEIMD